MCSLRKFLMALMALFTAIFIFVPAAYAEVVTVEAEGEYTMGDGDSMENMATYKEVARKNALRSAAEKVSVYVESFSEMKKEISNYNLTADQIRTISAKVPKFLAEDFHYDTSEDKKSMKIIYWVKVEVDPAKIDLKSLLEDRKNFNQSSQLEKQVKSLQDEILQLKDEQANTNADVQKQIEVSQKQFLIKVYEQNLFDMYWNTPSNKKSEMPPVMDHYVSEIRKLDPTNNVAQSVMTYSSDKQVAINDALNILKIDPENIVACATLVKNGYQSDHYAKIGIKAVRKNFAPNEIKQMTLSIVVNMETIYPSD